MAIIYHLTVKLECHLYHLQSPVVDILARKSCKRKKRNSISHQTRDINYDDNDYNHDVLYKQNSFYYFPYSSYIFAEGFPH